MFCANCGNNIADDSNFCPKCGTRLNRTNHTVKSAVPPPRGKPWEKVFWIDLYKNNKPGLFTIAALVLAMLGTFGYFVYSRVQGGFVVTVEKVGKEDELELLSKATQTVYCREFPAECAAKGRKQIERDIKLILPMVLRRANTPAAKITYKNNTGSVITMERFLWRTPPGPWQADRYDTAQTRYAPKIQMIRREVQTTDGNVAFATKVDLAGILTLTELDKPLQPAEERVWAIGYSNSSEFQVEYSQGGKLYKTPVLRVR